MLSWCQAERVRTPSAADREGSVPKRQLMPSLQLHRDRVGVSAGSTGVSRMAARDALALEGAAGHLSPSHLSLML